MKIRSERIRYLVAQALLAALALCAVPPACANAQAGDVRVIANVETRDVYVGESFLLQISVDGSDSAEIPDLSALDGFAVEYLGGSNNSSQSISIINGKVERTVQRGFVFTWRLTPQRTGRLAIPAIPVKVEGASLTTGEISISVKQPEESEDFKLRVSLSRETCYVGEPVVLNVTWYLRRDVQAFEFTAPLLASDAFSFEVPEVAIDPNGQYYRIPIAGREVIARKDRGILDGETYATLAFSIAAIPERPGTFVIPEFVVAAESGTGASSRRDFLRDFFNDDFTGRWRGSLRKHVVPSNRLSLTVRDLPAEGRPPGFDGHVGRYRIEAGAEPTSVNVGDPITLRVTLSGPDYLGRVDLPQLGAQAALARDFRIPEDRADGVVDGRKKVFTQTIRALREDIVEIPPIELVYFDTKLEQYATARSEPIPIEVRPTRIVTAGDAEGIEPVSAGAPLEPWKAGIAYNYEGPSVVERQDLGLGSLVSDVRVLLLLVAPPVGFLAVLAGTAVSRWRGADPGARRAKGALGQLRGRLAVLRRSGESDEKFCAAVLEFFGRYLGDRLALEGSALTPGEIERLISARGAGPELVEEIGGLLRSCEFGAYGGSGAMEDRERLIERAFETARRLEKVL
ncbi:MAG: BatD family protein [Candidatus Krumholzibacteria bacterium]|nr:BatD family protein [Candidatus Krumholzibacteria bacterium]